MLITTAIQTQLNIWATLQCLGRSNFKTNATLSADDYDEERDLFIKKLLFAVTEFRLKCDQSLLTQNCNNLCQPPRTA